MLPEPLFLSVHMYGIMVAVGLLLAFLVLDYCCRNLNVKQKFTDFVFYNSIGAVIFGFAGAAFFQALYEYIENPEKGFKINGDITVLGGLVSGAVFFLAVYFIFRKKFETKLTEILGAFPCAVTIAHAYGRLGCFFSGCCFGKQTDSFLGVKFPYVAEKVHPTQLYEAVFLFILFFTLLYLLVRKKSRHVMSIYLISYGIFRFLIEFLRDDFRGKFIGNISPSQFWSIIFVLLGIALFFTVEKANKISQITKEDIEIED